MCDRGERFGGGDRYGKSVKGRLLLMRSGFLLPAAGLVGQYICACMGRYRSHMSRSEIGLK